ncbi:hypothetical protein [Bacillus sp. 7884-1]|uniref:hypothetical protein n=1 Tax=Bacillus sp. 7884-1 TaxID=2021693 RepID=UPI000BA69A1C|nr:hypothetical protein [Bacillus sp. 7884-1]PAE37513.1 hypothetical protein CHI06_20125 [Bacillus sp. 7884-1]
MNLINMDVIVGGTTWESNPSDLPRRSQADLELEGQRYFMLLLMINSYSQYLFLNEFTAFL